MSPPPSGTPRVAGLRRRVPLTEQGRRGLFITVEGLDFSGKTTLFRNLKTSLANLGPPPYFTREPGGTPAAERIREVLLDPELDMDPWTEAYLYAAARADLVRREILPRLERGDLVLCERFLDSSLAYQGVGRGLGIVSVKRLNAWAVGELKPDLTFYLRLPARERGQRARASDAPPDRIERIGDEFMQRVEEGFEGLVRAQTERIRVLDAMLPPEELVELVLREIRSLQYTRVSN